MTSVLLSRAKKVVAVEFDKDLADKLPKQFPGKNLEVINQDILKFYFNNLPKNYKVVANVPYYITSKIIHNLMTSGNKPQKTVVLIQKEVAERAVANPGEMNLLAIGCQVYADVKLGDEVDASLFTPPPKVDSQVLVLTTRSEPRLPENISDKEFFRVVKAGFSAKRKKIRSSLSGGLALEKDDLDKLLEDVKISGDLRAEDLSIKDWQYIAKAFYNR